jgi:queuine tRNA-ribosyltransferase
MLAMRLCVMHNIYFYNTLLEKIRQALDENRYSDFYNEQILKIGQRI